jgi:hypothetical protein
MARECDHDAIEAVARGEDVPDRSALELHLAGCDECALELKWLRAERDLFKARRDEAPSVDALWSGIAVKLAPAAPAGVSPYRVAATPPPVRERRPWMAFAAGALAATVAIVTVGALTLRVNPNKKPAAHASHRLVQHGPARRVEVPVTGAVSVHLETWSADVRVRGGSASMIRVVMREGDAEPTVTRRADGRYDVQFGGGRLASGEVEIDVPSGSSLDATTASGAINVDDLGGSLRVETVSGDVRAGRVHDAEVTTSSGDVAIDPVDGRVRVRTVSGDVKVTQSQTANASPEITVESSSGDVEWRSGGAMGYRVEARTVSGDVSLAVSDSNVFSVRFTTISGELRDELGTGAVLSENDGTAVRHYRFQGSYGAEGSIMVSTTSGSLTLTRDLE